ncbi:hypothetical protein D0T84_11600 [Dysgonomonas sp. 521]|uniref:hypothetical protein n=1 Tax=Dysgonomonas sp. 521 TaxID=2302932 RepID=UPI0013D37258|nr:hypothetical protein [Dysgonomonas sp. 521]NDV95550.1 hypothetical protein [Dysgonomonas sp. 521]
MKNSLTPLEELRREKDMVRRECEESEHRLSDHWTYLSDNAGSLLFQSTVNAILSSFGFGANKKKQQEETSTSNSLLSGLTAYYPVVWELVQPLLWRYFMKKIKSIFSGKKKKKRKDDDD